MNSKGLLFNINNS